MLIRFGVDGVGSDCWRSWGCCLARKLKLRDRLLHPQMHTASESDAAKVMKSERRKVKTLFSMLDFAVEAPGERDVYRLTGQPNQTWRRSERTLALRRNSI